MYELRGTVTGASSFWLAVALNADCKRCELGLLEPGVIDPGSGKTADSHSNGHDGTRDCSAMLFLDGALVSSAFSWGPRFEWLLIMCKSGWSEL